MTASTNRSSGQDWFALRAQVAELFFPTASQEEALKRLRSLADPDPTRAYKAGMTLIGESQVGKSKVLEEWGKWCHVHIPERPIYSVNVGGSNTPLAMVAALLKEAGDPFWNRGREFERRERFRERVARERPLAIVFQEYQHTFSRTEYREASSAQFIKTLYNDIDVPIVLSGLPEVADFISKSRELMSRFSRAVYIDAADLTSKQTFKLVARLLKGISDLVPIDEGLTLVDQEMVVRFAHAGGGSMAAVKKIALEACMVAYEDELPGITMKTLQKALERHMADDQTCGQQRKGKKAIWSPQSFSKPLDVVQREVAVLIEERRKARGQK